MSAMTAWNIPDWLASGEVLFRTLLGALVLLVLWEVATLLAVLLRCIGDGDGLPSPSKRGGRAGHP